MDTAHAAITFCVGIIGLMCMINNGEGKAKFDLLIDYNPLNCDCRDYNVISISQFYVFSHVLDRVNCDKPPELYNYKVGFAHR